MKTKIECVYCGRAHTKKMKGSGGIVIYGYKQRKFRNREFCSVSCLLAILPAEQRLIEKGHLPERGYDDNLKEVSFSNGYRGGRNEAV